MNTNLRRNEILRMLSESDAYISAAQLAQHFGVTRQIIVSDVALLRANGNRIQATRKGYRLEKDEQPQSLRSVVCRHRGDQVLDEFYTIVDNGGSIASVVVEHPIYGELSADLNICSRYDAQEFVQRQQETNASQLCDLTGGLHIHMLRVPNEETYIRIVNGLKQLDILAEE
ncbi:MAG: transcription repressor NadR [Clostridia bacterium]|nr:transcription repressor NadR [Clostridia bacterium]MBP3651684.1 transcription repressor NadR [Clostridia bacterium]